MNRVSPLAHPLTTPEGEAALAVAATQSDPDSLATATALRARFAADLAASALTQVGLRRKARAKLGGRADRMLFTRDGLEQASRAAVAEHHAARFIAAGVRRVIDLGCGIGADALALVDAGLEVVAVEADPETASMAMANLGDRAEVLVGDAVELAPKLLGPGIGAYADPARRSTRGRSWRPADLSPPWSFVEWLLRQGAGGAGSARAIGVKLGPGLPHRLIPPAAEAEWISESGDTIEVGLWAGAGATAGRRVATLISGSAATGPLSHRMVVNPADPAPPVAEIGRYVYEPNGAVIRAGGIPQLAGELDAWLLHPEIAYLTAAEFRPTPYAIGFEVLDVLPYSEQTLRQWTRQHGVGTLEIKKRGVDLDPAVLRRKLKLRGSASATVILTRAIGGILLIVASRVSL